MGRGGLAPDVPRFGEARGVQDDGQVIVAAKIENIFDLEMHHRGLILEDQVRCVEVDDALVGTGAMGLMMPGRLIARLGLRHHRTLPVRGIGDTVAMPI